MCAGSLISPRLILSSFHCTYNKYEITRPCNHSDEKRRAYLGIDEFRFGKRHKYYSIPIIDVKYPENQNYDEDNFKTHDFAMLVLKGPAIFSPKIKPICLPKQNQEFGGKTATAAGFGMTASADYQNTDLRKVDLEVSTKKYEHTKMLGIMLESARNQFNNELIFKDTCAGDSGV